MKRRILSILVLAGVVAMLSAVAFGQIAATVTTTIDGKPYAGQVILTPTLSPTTTPATQPAVVITPATLPAADAPDVPQVLSGRPSIATTGPKGGIALRSSAGVKIVPAGVYDGYLFTTQLTVSLAKGQTVILRNCKIDAGGKAYGIRCDDNAGTLIIERCEILNVGSAGIYGANFQAIDNYIHRSAGDGIKPTRDALIQGNYIAELGYNSPNAHADGVQIRGGANIRIIGNHFDMPNGVPNTKSNSALFLQLATSNVLFDRNWCNGGNYLVHAYPEGGSDVRISNNVFTTGSAKYGVGQIGSTVTWSGNLSDKGQPVQPGDK